MRKYKIENGIYTTLTFHGRSMCWIRRRERFETKETPAIIDPLCPAPKIKDIRPLCSVAFEDLSNTMIYFNYALNMELIKHELILRN